MAIILTHVLLFLFFPRTVTTAPVHQTPRNETTPPSVTVIIVVVIVVVILVLVAIMIAITVVCVMKKRKSSRGVARAQDDVDREHEDVQELDETHEVIRTKNNEAYGQSKGMEMVRNEAYVIFRDTADVTYDYI